MNIRKLKNSEKVKFPFLVEVTFSDDIWWGGVGQEDQIEVGLVGAGEVMAGNQMGQDSGDQMGQMAGKAGMVGCRRVIWKLLEVVGAGGGW